jgi:hypothetical protein
MTHGVLRSGTDVSIRKFDFVIPSALHGVGAVLDIAATAELSNYQLYPTPDASDAKSLQGDWEVVGSHLRKAIQAQEERQSSS